MLQLLQSLAHGLGFCATAAATARAADWPWCAAPSGTELDCCEFSTHAEDLVGPDWGRPAAIDVQPPQEALALHTLHASDERGCRFGGVQKRAAAPPLGLLPTPCSALRAPESSEKPAIALPTPPTPTLPVGALADVPEWYPAWVPDEASRLQGAEWPAGAQWPENTEWSAGAEWQEEEEPEERALANALVRLIRHTGCSLDQVAGIAETLCTNDDDLVSKLAQGLAHTLREHRYASQALELSPGQQGGTPTGGARSPEWPHQPRSPEWSPEGGASSRLEDEEQLDRDMAWWAELARSKWAGQHVAAWRGGRRTLVLNKSARPSDGTLGSSSTSSGSSGSSEWPAPLDNDARRPAPSPRRAPVGRPPRGSPRPSPRLVAEALRGSLWERSLRLP